ncbi:MAG: ArsR/SmtB family transcription factor [Alphaproteobacteria bacterium]
MDDLLAWLKAAAEPTRLRLLALLDGNELTVSELTQILGQSQPRVSRHLKLMAEAGLVERFSEGTWAFYRLSERVQARSLVRSVVDLIPEDDDIAARDLDQLEQVKAARASAAAAYFSDNAENWDRIRSLYTPEDKVEEAILALLGNEPIGTLLDVGTGTGRILSVLSGQIDRGIGIDINRDMLAVARANLDEAGASHCQVRQGDMYHMGIVDGGADTAIFHQVLHFAEDPASAVREAGRVVGPGGRLLIVDFAPHELEYLRADHAHRRLGFADEEVAAWCRAAGFTDVSVKHMTGGELTVALWLARRKGSARPDLRVVEQGK